MGKGRVLSWERGHHRQFDTPQFYRGEAALGMIFPVTLLSPSVSETLRNWERVCQRAAGVAVAWTAVRGDGEGAQEKPFS